ncbi:TEA-domain-containing protein [Testicularia cyperi]|uniref:TEA-domain-containing protein n=1 Tax=Testicularia cyperi TaxID=1882483 RepID=A0A317XP06_9BASI|nr:TEA-domain-containing protein [Testicularia cyperi]
MFEVGAARRMSYPVDSTGAMTFAGMAGQHSTYNNPHVSSEQANTGSLGTTTAHGLGAEFLMSPPRLTVSMSSSSLSSSGNTATPQPAHEFSEDAKRRRTSEVDATPERSSSSSSQHQLYHAQMQMLAQQTPPNLYAYQQHPQFSLGGASSVMGLETPMTTASTGSVPSSISPSPVRRLSLTSMDRASHIANLTANLMMPSTSSSSSSYGHGGASSVMGHHPQHAAHHISMAGGIGVGVGVGVGFENMPPKSAPPRAASDAMQRAQEQAALLQHTNTNSSAQHFAYLAQQQQQLHPGHFQLPGHHQPQQQQPPHQHPAVAAASAARASPNKLKSDRPSSQNLNSSNSNANLNAANATSANSKSQDVWPDDVEVAFWEALRLIPKLGRRKVLVHGKPCGRNELIADYIERKTNKVRTRKQVSSHIQVLKNIRKGDPEFQQLIAEPTNEEDFYIPAGGMMYAQTLAGYGYGGLGGAYPLLSIDGSSATTTSAGGLLSPYTPGLSMGGSLASPISPGAPPMSATHSITSGLNDLHFPQPPASAKDTSGKIPCPILPASFSMWVHCSSGDDKHVYTNLDRNSMTVFANNQAALPQMTLDSVRVGHFRFPRLAEMYHRMPCQFLHVHVPLSVPRHDVMMPRYDHFSTQLSLTSAQDLRLTSVTTVYSHGKRVLSLVEPLDAPRRISGRNGTELTSSAIDVNAAAIAAKEEASVGDLSINSTSSHSAVQTTNPEGGVTTPTGNTSERRESNASSVLLSPASGSSSEPTSPRTPLDVNNSSASSLRHRWSHQAPFATDFWADFLSRNHPVNVYGGRDGLQSFGKEPSERAALGMAVSGVTIIQELVVANEDAKKAATAAGGDSTGAAASAPTLLNDAGNGLSPGSKVGDVVLVIAWDLECVEALGTTPGTPTVSLLTMGSSASPMGRGAALPSPLHQANHGALPHSPMTLMPGLSPMSAYPGAQMQPQQAQQQQQQLQQLQQPMVMANPPALVHTQPSPQPQLSLKSESQASGGLQPPALSLSSSQPTLLRKRGLSMNKPNLMVSIPPAPSYLNPQKALNSALLSPHPQLTPAASPTAAAWGLMQQRAMQTPVTPFAPSAGGLFEPPPLNSGDDVRMQKERLERHWATQADPMSGPLPSPLDMSFNVNVSGSGEQTGIPASASFSSTMDAADSSIPHSGSALGLSLPGSDAHGNLLSPAAFDMGQHHHHHHHNNSGDNNTDKMHVTTGDSGNNSFESMFYDTSLVGQDANTQEYLNGLLASIGVDGQDFSSHTQ